MSKGDIFHGFVLTLPIGTVPPTPLPTRPGVVLPLVSSTLRVLVVDDVMCNRKLLARMVATRFKMQVDLAASGPEALSMLRTLPCAYSCIFLDNVMPDMSGLEVAREIRRMPHLTDIGIIGVTGNTLG